MKVGVVVGRFQIDNLHDGHDALLKAVAERSDVLCVVLGTTENKVSRRNPLDFTSRKALIEGWYVRSGVKCTLVVLPKADEPSDASWSKGLDKMLNQTFPGANTTLYGGRDSFLKQYLGKLKTEDLSQKLPVEQEISATVKREQASSTPSDNDQFRKGVIYAAYNQWPRLFMCVDVAPMNGDTLYVGKRTNEELLRFFGGFVDITDESLESAAAREVREEAGVEGSLEYLGSFKVPDYRYKTKDDGLVMTAFFLATNFSSVSPGDDIDEVVELHLGAAGENEALVEKMNNSHKQLMRALLKKLGR